MLERQTYPVITVVIPSYNQGKYIEETLLSVLGQNYPHLEVIVIDGGSTDHTVEILQAYDDQIAYWHSQPDQGQSDAINQGMRRSSGQVLCWLNSDDMYLPGTLLDIGLKFRDRTAEMLVIHGGGLTINQDLGSLASDAQISMPIDKQMLTYQNPILQPSTFWTRSLWDKVGELNVSLDYVMDWDWFVRAAQVGQFEYAPRFYSIYRYHDDHKTSSGGEQRRQEIATMVSKYASDYWSDLFRTVDENYQDVVAKVKLMNSISFLPKRHLLWKLLSPQKLSELKSFWDLIAVLNVYGLNN
ncbi:glycosyl transferase family 2 (plasmid) [Thalassoporum mexicanum PCC 7367]|uniref:glycosyltransferase family 2 protein n=1 Tax=Thalassoporum mexicanum TaxID=3457544 RepID=UPI00029FDE66|nr:glycosyltransferase family 2 protein [Pseudanabaena sp. PCC 7367]AFY72027.1 glycosyl transferase family 2 [Pseudanabaena sp. PCC 7367]